jgi:hypothetical protein
MKTRGKNSAASLQVVSVDSIETMHRPDAPYDLTDEQSTEWWAVVNRMPADWFPRETHGLLAQYCRHIITARRIAQLIKSAEEQDPLDVNYYDQLLKMQEREGRAASSLATRLRITQQSTYDKSKKKAIQADRPWKG